MGFSRTPGELARKMEAAAVLVDGSTKVGLEAAALTTKRTILVVAPNRLRNVGRSGARLNVRYTIAGTRALVFATGPWGIIEDGTKAHEIKPRRKRGKRAALSFGGKFAAHTPHPGTHGQHPWRRGVEAARPLIPREFDKTTEAALRSVFG